jgi:hypothetical protein
MNIYYRIYNATWTVLLLLSVNFLFANTEHAMHVKRKHATCLYVFYMLFYMLFYVLSMCYSMYNYMYNSFYVL